MAEKDIIMAKQKELKRLHLIHKTIEKAITQADASRLISRPQCYFVKTLLSADSYSGNRPLCLLVFQTPMRLIDLCKSFLIMS